MSSYEVTVNGETYTVQLRGRRGSTLNLSIDDQEYSVGVDPNAARGREKVLIRLIPKASVSRGTSTSRASPSPEVKAPLPGIISDVKVGVGDKVSAGATLVVIEAMKMENPIKAPADATVSAVHVSKGKEVTAGHLLITLDLT